MKRTPLYAIALLLAVMASGCQEEQFTVPAFIHLDGIDLKIPDENAVTSDSGFYTSDIVAAYVVAHVPGRGAVDTIGLFTLPFTTPILYNGPLDYIDIFPAVQQSGSSKALPFYTFYHSIRRTGMTLNAGDTLNLGRESTTYNLTVDDVLGQQTFEAWGGSLQFDSVVQRVNNARDEARTGEGYGRVHVGADESSKAFAINNSYTVTDATKLLYLELDTRSDMNFEVYMHSSYRSGAAEDKLSVMVVRGSSDWQHLYINLGRTWSYFNYNKDFRISFSALNLDGIEGDVRIDNVRLLTTSVVL